MQLITISTTIVLSLIIIGIGLGFVRGWKRSLIRFGFILASLIAAIFIAPAISNWFISKYASGSSLTLFSTTIDFQEILEQASGETLDLTELFAEGSATNDLILSFMNIVVNLALFVVIFIGCNLVTVFVYWIILLIFKIKDRYEVDEKPERDGKYWGLKSLGAFIGVLGSLVICFAVLTPVFGVMNVCDGFVVEAEKDNEQAAAATTSLVCGNLYYTEDDKIGKIEGYIEKYANLKKGYDKSFLGKFLKYTGLKKLGSLTFDKLTTVKQGGLKVNLTDEFIQIVKVYNGYKDIFVKEKFDITDNNDIDDLMNLYDEAIESNIVENYIIELIPKASRKWSNDEKFLGISSPIVGEWSPVVKASLVVFKIDNINRISNNLKALTSAVKVGNNYGIVKAVQEKQKIEDLLGDSGNFVKEEIVILTSTVELRENVSIILNESFEVLYKQIIGEEKDFADNQLSIQEIAAINEVDGWAKEAEQIQETVIKTFVVYDVIKNDSSSEVLVDQLENIGVAIDAARKSKLISKPYKTFIEGFIDKKLNIKESAKEEILESINSKWDDSTFNFTEMFKTIQATALIAKDISDKATNISLDSLKDTLKNIADNAAMKEVVSSIVNSNIIETMVPENKKETAAVMTDMLETLMSSDSANSSTVENDIKAGNQIVNIVNAAENNGGNMGLTEESADQMVADLTGSAAIMEMLSDDSKNETVSGYAENISTEDKAAIENSINKLEDGENKTALKKLFNIA